jgi:hypothetical protein
MVVITLCFPHSCLFNWAPITTYSITTSKLFEFLFRCVNIKGAKILLVIDLSVEISSSVKIFASFARLNIPTVD